MNELLHIHNVSVIRMGEKAPEKILFIGKVFKTIPRGISCSDCDLSTYCKKTITTDGHACRIYLVTHDKKKAPYYLNSLKFVE